MTTTADEFSAALVDVYCRSARYDSMGSWKKYVFRGDPVSRALMAFLSLISGDFIIDGALNQQIDKDTFWSWSSMKHWAGGWELAVCVVLWLAILLVALLMLCLPCCACYRNCWGFIFCRCCVRDRPRVAPISATSPRKRKFIKWWVFSWCLLASLALVVATAFSIKFAFTPKYMVCQMARVGVELKNVTTYLDPSSDTSWIPDKATGYDLSTYKYDATPTILDPTTGTAHVNAVPLDAWNTVKTTIQPYIAGKYFQQNQDGVDKFITWFFCFGLLLVVIGLAGLGWLWSLWRTYNRYIKEKEEPKRLLRTSRAFTALWIYLIFAALFIYLLVTPTLNALGHTNRLCQLGRKIPKDISVLKDYPLFSDLYSDDPKAPIHLFTELCLRGSDPDTVLTAAWPTEMEAFKEAGIEVTLGNLDLCKAEGNSLGSMVDGFCGGVQQDLFWVSFSMFLVATAFLCIWPIAYKISHYFKDRLPKKFKDRKIEEPIIVSSPVSKSESWLLAEAKHGDLAQVQKLAKEIDPVTVRDARYNNTTLHCAAASGDTAVVRDLLDRKADPNERNKFGYTPLGVAAAEGHAAVVTQLIAAGGDPKVTDEFGETPLHAAARSGDLPVVEALCSENAPEPTYLNDEGECAVDTAAHHQRVHVEEFLDVRTPRGLRKTPPSFNSPVSAATETSS